MQSNAAREWFVIAGAACVSLYGAWLYFQPGRKLPPLRSTFSCRFVHHEDISNLGEDFVILRSAQNSSGVESPLCVASISPLIEQSAHLTATQLSFDALFKGLKCAVVTSDLFDLDRLCAVFIFVFPKIAFLYPDLLLAIADANGTQTPHSQSIRFAPTPCLTFHTQ